MSREKIIDVMCEGWDLRPVSIEQRCRGLLTALEAAGYAIVPVEADLKMDVAGIDQMQKDAPNIQPHRIYRAMIQSAKGK